MKYRSHCAASLWAIVLVLAVASSCGGLVEVEPGEPGPDDPGSSYGGDGDGDVDGPTVDASVRDGDVSDAPVSPDAFTIDPARPHAKILLVHASPNLGAFRLCFGDGSSRPDHVAKTFPALPDQARGGQPWPGVFPGTGGVFPDLGVDLAPLLITPYVIAAESIENDTRSGGPNGGAERSCDELIGADGKGGALRAGVDYHQLATISEGTFKNGLTLLVAVSGCIPGSANGGSIAQCGADWTAEKGNLSLEIVPIFNVSRPGAMVVDVAHVSLPLQLSGPAKNGIYPFVSLDVGVRDAPTVWLSVAAVKNGTVAPLPPLAVSGVDPTKAGFGFALTYQGPSIVTVPLSQIQRHTLGSPSPVDYFKNGAAYTFVLVGDPFEPPFGDGGAPNAKSLHFLAFPNDLSAPLL